MNIQNRISGFLNDLRLRGLSSKTVEAYGFANMKFLEKIHKEPKFVTSGDIKQYIGFMLAKKMKPKTINLNIAALKSYYDDYLGRRLFAKIKRVKLEKPMPNVLSREELKRMIECMPNQKHRLIIKLLYSTGIRAGELVKLKLQDIDFDNGFARIIKGKGKKDRLTIISKELCKELKKYAEGKCLYFLFPGREGNALTIRSVEDIVKAAAKNAGVMRRVYPHALRASFASHLYDDGVQLQKIQKLMGHSDYKTTLVYVKSATVDISGITNPLDSI